MAIEIQNTWTSLESSESTLTFQNDISQYLVGISAFELAYSAGSDHHVEQMSINLSVSQPQPNMLTINASGILSDADGHQLDPSQSHLYVTAIACSEGSMTSGVLLSASISLGNDQVSAPIPLPAASERIMQAGLTGFNLCYSGTDHHVEHVEAGVFPTDNGTSGYVNALAAMFDASGDQANAPTAGGVLLASAQDNPGFIVQSYSAQNGDENTIQMPQAVSQAVVLLSGFKAVYPGSDDHHVARIGAGPSSVQVDSADPTVVQTNGVWAFMNDASGNSQDMQNSICNLIVIGIPA